MSLRWRKNGELLCAAKCSPKAGDTYIGDRLHHQLHSELKVIVANLNEEDNGLWHWSKDVFMRTENETV